MKRYLFSYDDDNHYKIFWFDGEYIGSLEEVGKLLITMYNYGLEGDPFDPDDIEIVECGIDVELNDRDFEVLHNYLRFPREISMRVWRKLVKRDYVNAVNIIRGELT